MNLSHTVSPLLSLTNRISCCVFGIFAFIVFANAAQPDLDASFLKKERYAIFDHREPVDVKLLVGGSRESDDSLKWQVLDFCDRVVAEGSYAIPTGAPPWSETLHLESKSAGYFELHLKLEKSNSTIPREGSRPPGYLAFAVLPDIIPVKLAHPDDSRFGIQGRSFVDSGRDGEGDPFGPIYGLLGVRWAYEYFEQPWLKLPAFIEKLGPNTFTPTLDPKVFLEQKKFEMKNDLSVLFDMHSIPPWLMNMPAGKSIPLDKLVPTHNCQDYPPRDWEYYGDLLRRLASEKALMRKTCFPGMKRSYYQIHWEPEGYWKGTDEEFIHLYEVAHQSIEQADPGAFLLGADYGIIADGNRNLERLLPKGLGKYLDGVVTHSYILAHNGENGVAPEEGGLVQEARKLMHLVRQYLPPGAPVYNTEGSSQNNGFDPEVSHWILKRQAGWILRHHLIGLGEGFSGTWFFILADNDAGASGYGLLYNLTYPNSPYASTKLAPKPVFSAAAAATRLLEGTTTRGPLEYLGENVLGYSFNRNGDVLAVIWSTDDKTRKISVPVGEDDVSLYDPMGNRTEIHPVDGEVGIQIDGNPVYLLGLRDSALPVLGGDPIKALSGEPIEAQLFPSKPPSDVTLRLRCGETTIEIKERPFVLPPQAHPGTWLTQIFCSGKLQESRLLTVLPPVKIQTSGDKVGDKTFRFTLKNQSKKKVTGTLCLKGDGFRSELGKIELEAGEARDFQTEVFPLLLGKRTFKIELEGADCILAESGPITANIDFAARAAAPPKLDGDLSKWANAHFYKVAGDDALVIRDPKHPLGKKDDLEFQASFQYDERALYIAVKVRDQAHVQNHLFDDSWREDSVQIGLAIDWDGEKWKSFQKLCLALREDGRTSVKRNSGTDFPSMDFNSQTVPRAFRRGEGETIYEVGIPWSEIGAHLKGVPPQGKIGVGILVNDVDEMPPGGNQPTEAGSQVIKTEVAAAEAAANPRRKAMEAYGGMFFGRPESFGILFLEK